MATFPHDSPEAAATVAWLRDESPPPCGAGRWPILAYDPMARAAAGAAFMAGIAWERAWRARIAQAVRDATDADIGTLED